MKAIGFNLGQFGDLAMNIIAARSFKNQFPDSKLTFGISKKYSSCKDLFLYNPYIDDIHIYEGYDEWPTKLDQEYLFYKKFDHIFNGMPQHTSNKWFENYHQTQEVCAMHGLHTNVDLQINLNNYFNYTKEDKLITIAPFGGYGQAHKSLSDKKIQDIINFCQLLGYSVLQIGHESEPSILKNRFIGNYVESVIQILKSKLFITVDTGLNWFMSGYKHPVLALYSNDYFGKYLKNIQPINPNAQYLDADNLNNIENEVIFDRIKEILK